MMRDVVENKRLVVRDSAPDYRDYGAHPLLSVNDNNMFRAVHDFFGHAGSGRGFLADGEEAAWISHSEMFSPLARKAMTTETRGQNSWVNKYGKSPDGTQRFAEQKAFLLPDDLVFAPTEYAAVERKVGATNLFAGVKTAALEEFTDHLLPGLGMVFTPVKSSKMYSPVEVKQMTAKIDELAQASTFKPGTPEVSGVNALLKRVGEYLAMPSRYAVGASGSGDESIVEILRLANEAFAVSDAKVQESRMRSLAMFRQLLDEPVDATELLENALRLENRVVTDPKPFSPTIWGVPAKPGVLSKPPFSKATLEEYFPDDELLRDTEGLRIAFNETKFQPGTAGSKKAATQQQIIWENFRARNHDVLAEVEERQRNQWFAKNSIENSSLFTKMPDGTVLGQGMLPTSIPVGTLYTHNGRPTTTIAALLDNLGKVITRTGPQMGGLPTARIMGQAGRATPAAARVSGSQINPVTGQREFFEENVTRGADIVLDDGARIAAREVTGGIAAPTRKQIITAIRKRGREIELDSYPLATQAWLLGKLDELSARVSKNGAKDIRLLDETPDMEGVIQRVWEDLPFLKSRADARKLVLLGPEAVTQLSKAPARKYFIDTEFDRLIGAPDTSGIQRTASTAGNRSSAQVVARDPESGVPIDRDGNPVPENQADATGYTQYRTLTEGKKAYTGRLSGRSGSQIVSQTGTGPQQLAGLQAIRSTIGAINESITAKTFAASPEQAKLLSSVLNSLQIATAPNASPTKIFKQFQEEALPRFEEIVTRIESAAKIESVAYYAKSIFRVADEESISLMKAIDNFDPGELQKQSVKFTDDALSLIDDTCRMATQGVNPRTGGPAGSSILNQVLGGFGG
jgi:hypothetical protein